ncbi:MAG: PEP-CTERM sorting domain-containing protein, partial [Planctomycetota bacterium]
SAETAYGYYGYVLFGDNLTGSMAIVNVGATWDIAQVVTNDVGSVSMNFFLSGVGGGEVIPEPATMGLLVIGGLGALIRRRK